MSEDIDFSLESMLRCPICGSHMVLSWEKCASGNIECMYSAECENGCGGFQFGEVCILRGTSDGAWDDQTFKIHYADEEE